MPCVMTNVNFIQLIVAAPLTLGEPVFKFEGKGRKIALKFSRIKSKSKIA